jgi:molybdopterin molybdotransferase
MAGATETPFETGTTIMTTDFIRASSCADDYDPDSMPVDVARKYIRNYLSPVSATEAVPLRESLGRILAEDVIAPCNVPNHDNSAMDGYALAAADIRAGESRLRIAGTAFAGRPHTGAISPGECVRIMTGAVMPPGCDTVVMQEHVRLDDGTIAFGEGVKPGQNVRPAGDDLRQGQVVLPAGHRMRPADLGLIASLGIGQVNIYRKLRVAFFSTGDELTSIGRALEAGQVYDSNRYTLYGMLVRLGVEIQDMGVVRDDPMLLEQALQQAAANADVILTSGGVSVGEADYMKQLLNDMGQVVFWKIAMKPGRPLAYGKIGQAHYFGLPGNPVAVMTTFYQFVRDALLVLMGQPNPPALPLLNAICTEKLKKAPGRTEFQRGVLFVDQDGTWKVRPTGNQSSGVLRSMSEASCFIVLPVSNAGVAAGETVQVQVLEGLV